MIKKYNGIVTLGDGYRCADDVNELYGSIHIGGVDVVDDIKDAGFAGPVTVAIADDRFDGELSVEIGWGYSEYTPVDSDNLTVGAHDLIDLVSEHVGKEITLWIADEPVNILE